MAESGLYRLEVAARAQSLAVIRLFAATVLRLYGVGEEAVDDAKLAVSELATSSILSGSDERIVVSARETNDGVVVTVGPYVAGLPATEERMDIVASLFASVRIDAAAATAGFLVDLVNQ